MEAFERFIGLMIVAALAASVSASAQENLVANPGFEEVNPDDATMPAGWQPHGAVTEQLTRHLIDDAHSGGRALLVVDGYASPERESENTASAGIKQRVDGIEVGRSYLLTCWAKCFQRNGTRDAWLQLRFKPSNEIANTHLSGPVGQWRKYTAFGVAPEGTTHAEVYIKTLHMGACRYVVDDFSLTAFAADGGDQRMSLLARGATGIAPKEMRTPNLHTPIVEDGRPAAHILVPDDKQWHDIGLRLAAEIEVRSGVKLTVETDGKWALASNETTIAIGNLNNNFVAERMWLNRYQRVDSLRPGAGEYILQTIPEPYDCPLGKNVLLVGASDLAGAERGVEALLERLGEGPELSLDEWTLVVSNAEPMSEEAREKLLGKKLSKFWLKDFWQAARSYQTTGDIAYAERAREVLLAIAKRYRDYARDPDILKYWPAPTGSGDKRIYWSEETTSEWIGCMWDFIEEAPVFSDEERYTCANALVETCNDLTRCVYYWGKLADPETVTPVAFNHTTFPLLGVYFLARHFERNYGNVDGRLEDYLARVRNCFTPQLASWKPTEDATGYLSIVPAHTITWSLAEGDYSYFESGAVKTLADYTVGFCDNTGDAASFGDNGYGRGVYTRNLDWAVWYYDDANIYWWLDRVSSGGWQNPFDPALKPERWTDLAGVRIFPLTEPLYRYTALKWNAPNVPLEKCFDKISFRENLDPDGQYFLLDGYARGGHMHYDGNAIIKFYADGEDWLIDGDYLVRNTTDHNMVSVIRDGRCEAALPECASLEHLLDRPGLAMTQTGMSDYNGANWLRNIFWLKGGPMLVIDRTEAAEAGDYKFESVWKLIDRGQVGGDGQRTFSLTRAAVAREGLTVVKNPQEDVAAAVRFDGANSRLSFSVDLPQGTYTVNVCGLGLNGGADSFWLTMDDGTPVAFHLPLETYRRSYDSGVNPKSGSAPKMTVKTDGAHLVVVTLRESPGVFLDKVEFVAADGNVVASVEAEDTSEAVAEALAALPDKSFFIVGDGASTMFQSTRLNHARLPIRYLHQAFAGSLAAGEALSNQALLYNTDTSEAADYDLRRINTDAAVLLDGRQPLAVVAAGAESLALPPELASDAALAFLGRDRWVLCDATRVGSLLLSPQPVSVDLNLMTGVCVVIADPATEIKLCGATPRIEGETELIVPADSLARFREEWGRALTAMTADALAETVGQQVPAREATLTPKWSVPPATYEERAQPTLEVIPADLDGDGVDEILAIRGRYLTCIDAAGRVMWEFDGTDELYAACAWDIDGDGAQEVFCGGKSKLLYVLEPDGTLIGEHPIETYWRVSRTTIHEPRLDDVLVRDFDGDGNWEAVLGTVDGFTQGIDHNFKQTWIYGETNHGTTEMQAVDVDGDGTLEVAVGNRYGKLFVFDALTGKVRARVYSELGDVQIAVADLDGDGTFEALNGSATGVFKCGRVGSRDVAWEFPNYGYAFRDIEIADVAASPGLEPIIASDTGYVYVLAANGATLSSRDLGAAVLDLAVDGDTIAAGCLDGSVYLLDGALEETGFGSLPARVNSVVFCRTDEGTRLVAGSEDGSVVMLSR